MLEKDVRKHAYTQAKALTCTARRHETLSQVPYIRFRKNGIFFGDKDPWKHESTSLYRMKRRRSALFMPAMTFINHTIGIELSV